AAWSRRGSRLQRFISNQDADIVFLTEVTRRWEQRLPDLDPRYPHVRAMPLPNAFGFALLSKFEVSEYQVHYLNADRLPVLEATIETPTTPLEVIGVHLYSPISKRMVTKRNQQLRELEKLFTPTTNPRLLLGDLNITAYSGYYQRFLEESGLSDSLPSWKLTPTWPSWYPMFRIQIDHCLGSNKLQGLERKAGSRFGSDHLPLFCDYGFVK
ncbi:MAG: endonuclease/exonuclease/phosphatase family protein, partial [Pseudomonadota bacterium]